MQESEITSLPLTSLVTPTGPARFHRDVGTDDIRKLLQQGSVRFVVANIGEPLRWIAQSECFEFWKQEVKCRVAEPTHQVHVQDFPEEYCYIATEWYDSSGLLILLATAH